LSRFLYMIEGAKAANATAIADAGLADRLADPIASRETVRGPGPDGRGGIVAAAGAADGLGFYPDRQEWTPIPGRSGVYIGLPTDEPPPGPADLARGETIAGYPIELGDGNTWIVPVGRMFPEGTQLPQALAIGPDGALVRDILPAFAVAGRLADRIWNAIRTQYELLDDGEKPTEIDDLEAFEMAVAIVALNYRVAVAEASALRILTTANVRDVLGAFVDWPAWTEAVKKNATPEPEPPDSGSPDSSPDTSPPEPISQSSSE